MGFSDEGTLAERWDGRRWTVQPSPIPTHHADALEGVACPSVRLCVAVGGNRTGAALAERWNGRRWTAQPIPIPAHAQMTTLASISCPTAKICVAVGFTLTPRGLDRALIERWNGKRWTIERSAEMPGSQPAVLAGVSCPAVNACTAVGTVVERWNGRRWMLQSTPPPPGSQPHITLLGVSCPAVKMCTAVGMYVDAAGHTAALTARWAANTWTVQPLPPPAGAPTALVSALRAVSCPSLHLCVAVGESNFVALAVRWSGSTWTTDTVPTISGSFAGVSCPSTTTCMAAGDRTTPTIARTLAAGQQR